jgi:hypothetical protein
MRLDSFVSDGVESLARLTKYRPDFPFSSDYSLGRQWGAAAHRDLECHLGEWDPWELKSASRGWKLESYKLELVAFDWCAG